MKHLTSDGGSRVLKVCFLPLKKNVNVFDLTSNPNKDIWVSAGPTYIAGMGIQSKVEEKQTLKNTYKLHFSF